MDGARAGRSMGKNEGKPSSGPKLPPKARKIIAEHHRAAAAAGKKGAADAGGGLSEANQRALAAQAPDASTPMNESERNRHIVVEERDPATYIQGDIFRISCGSKGVEGIRSIADPIKRYEAVVSRMRRIPGIELPPREVVFQSYKQDLETIWRIIEKASLVGSRGKTIHEAAAGKKGSE